MSELRRAAIGAGAFNGDEADDAEEENDNSDYDSESKNIHLCNRFNFFRVCKFGPVFRN